MSEVQEQKSATSDDSGKKPWQSKTLIIAALTALAPLISPVAAAWIAANPAIFSAGMGVVFGALRIVSKNEISIS